MASILMLSRANEGIPLANRLAQEGHICKIFSLEYEGLMQNGHNPSYIKDPFSLLEQFDLVLSTTAGLGDMAETCKERGKPTIGGSFNDKMELDQEYCNSVISLLYPNVKDLPAGMGIKICVTGWFNGKGFLSFSHSLKYDKMMEHNRGVDINTGCVTWICKENRLIKESLIPLIDLLTKVTYVGPITIDLAVFEDTVIPLNFTTTLDTSFYSFLELVKCSTWDILWKCTLEDTIQQVRETDFSISVNLSIPPYPYLNTEGYEPLESYLNIPPPARPHTFCFPQVNGFLGYICARGESINEARRRVYRTINNIVLSDSIQYRSDIGYNFEDKFQQLKQWGWLNA